MPYLSPGVYVEELYGSTELIPRLSDAASGSAPFLAPVPTRPVRSHWPAPGCTAAFVGIAERGPVDTPVLVTGWAQYGATFGGFVPDAFLAHAVYGFFLNGGQACYVVRVGTDGAEAAAASCVLVSAGPGDVDAYLVTARRLGPAGNALTVEVGPAGTAGDGAFDLKVWRDGELVEVFTDLVFKGRGRRVAETTVNDLSAYIQLSVVTPRTRPADGAVALRGGEVADAGSRVAEIVGDSQMRTGLSCLEALAERVQLVAVPDLMALAAQGQLDQEAVQAVQLAVIAHCELMDDRFAVLDCPPGLSPAQAREWRIDSTGYDTYSAAVYYPWIKVHDPVSNGFIFVPPSGHVAGVFARTAATKGIHCSPANEPLRGAVGAEYPLTRAEIDLLNPAGINAIVAPTGSAISVLGGRTLSSDPAWNLIRRRTLASFVETSVTRATRWVIHETVDPALWDQVTHELERFFDLLLQAGALSGSSPEEAYFVRCDAGTNPAEDRDRVVKADVVLNLAGGLPLNLRLVWATV